MRFALIVLLCVATPVFSQTTQTTTGACAPAIAKVDGNVTVTCITYTTIQEVKAIAEDNLSILIKKLQIMESGKGLLLMPALRAFQQAPTDANWAIAREQIEELRKLLKAATTSLVLYDAGLADHFDDELVAISENTERKDAALYYFYNRTDKPSTEEVGAWIEGIKASMAAMKTSLEALRTRLENPA